ncbi:MAG: Nif3-like dinuclear metal center hexameric protein [bacterium]|nr:Nif3-like dinuclear metal center hexameric protein [bacterium]
MTKLRDIFFIMEEIAPSRYASDWDSIGLQIGDPLIEAKGIMIALDPSVEAVNEAAAEGLNLLITHHPLLFTEIKSLDLSKQIGKIIKTAIKLDVAIFSAHTNLDATRGGVSDMLAELLHITELSPLQAAKNADDDLVGIGRIGTFKNRPSLSDVVNMLKERLNLDKVRVIGDMDRVIEKVALCGGSGGSLIEDASELKADLYISGDINYHRAKDALDLGLAIIDIGHFSSEKCLIEGLAKKLKEKIKPEQGEIPILTFGKEKEPFTIL